MRRILCVVVTLALLALSASALAANGLPLTGVAFVHNPDPTDRLNLRTQPRQSALSLGKYYSGAEVTLLGEEKNGYVKVRVDPFEGWMDAAYLVSSDGIYNDALPTTTVTASSANLREMPDESATFLLSAAKGETVTVLGVRDDNWLHVRAGGRRGFMRADLLADAYSFHKSEAGQAAAGATGGALVRNPDPQTRLNLRAAPDSSSDVLGKYFSGTEVVLLDAPKDGWVRVQIAGTATGYVQAQYLAMNGERVENAMPTPKIANKGGTGLNLREKPSTGTKSLGLYKNGTQVTVMGVYGGWVHVMVDGKVGYMQADKFDTDNGLTYEPMK